MSKDFIRSQVELYQIMKFLDDRKENTMLGSNFQGLQKLMDQEFIQSQQEGKKLSQDEGVSLNCANDIIYLRTRTRWTADLELELKQLHKAGTPPNIMEFGTGKVNLLESLVIRK